MEWIASATTPVSFTNTSVFRTTLTALTEPRTLWQRITCFPSPRQQFEVHCRAPGSAGDMFGSTLNHSRAVWQRQYPCRERCWCAWNSDISNNPSFRLKHPGVPDGSDGSDGTSYPLTENYTFPVAQATGHVSYSPPLLSAQYTHHQNNTCVTLFAGAAVML